MQVGDLVKCNGLVAKDPKEPSTKAFGFAGLHQILKKYRNKHGAPRVSLLCLLTGSVTDGIRPCAVEVLS
jgi:hypothetical protein